VLYNSFLKKYLLVYTFANLICLCLTATFVSIKERPELAIFIHYLMPFLFDKGYNKGSLTVTSGHREMHSEKGLKKTIMKTETKLDYINKKRNQMMVPLSVLCLMLPIREALN